MVDEYISRLAAVDAVRACCLEASACNLQCIKDIPAADVREVVLCRDCKYYNDETCDRWSDGTYLKPDDFCSRAARK